MTTITTANGPTELVPVYCEVTNKRIAWMTIIPDNCLPDTTPAYVSFKVVNKKGVQILDATSISTF